MNQKDIYFFLGTTLGHHLRSPNPFIIIGVFYPPFTKQKSFYCDQSSFYSRVVDHYLCGNVPLHAAESAALDLQVRACSFQQKVCNSLIGSVSEPTNICTNYKPSENSDRDEYRDAFNGCHNK